MQSAGRRLLTAVFLAGLAAGASAAIASDARPARCPRTSKADFVVQLPPLGEVKVWTYLEPEGEPWGAAVLCDRRGHLLRKLKFLQGAPGDINARQYDVPGWPAPVLAIASTWPRADGITVDEVLMTVSEGRLKEVLPNRPLDFADALCLGPQRLHALLRVDRGLRGRHSSKQSFPVC